MDNFVLELFQQIGAKEIKKEKLGEYKKLISRIVELSEKARKEGIIALEPAMHKEKDLLRSGLCMLIDGYERSWIMEILCTRIIADNYRNFMKRIIMLQGIKCIHDGENPRIVEERLNSFLWRSIIC